MSKAIALDPDGIESQRSQSRDRSSRSGADVQDLGPALQTPSDPDHVGESLDRKESLQHKLGRGGFGPELPLDDAIAGRLRGVTQLKQVGED